MIWHSVQCTAVCKIINITYGKERRRTVRTKPKLDHRLKIIINWYRDETVETRRTTWNRFIFVNKNANIRIYFLTIAEKLIKIIWQMNTLNGYHGDGAIFCQSNRLACIVYQEKTRSDFCPIHWKTQYTDNGDGMKSNDECIYFWSKFYIH